VSPERAVGLVADLRVEDPRDGQDLRRTCHPPHAIPRGGPHDARTSPARSVSLDAAAWPQLRRQRMRQAALTR
jgi:hypothetical protein